MPLGASLSTDIKVIVKAHSIERRNTSIELDSQYNVNAHATALYDVGGENWQREITPHSPFLLLPEPSWHARTIFVNHMLGKIQREQRAAEGQLRTPRVKYSCQKVVLHCKSLRISLKTNFERRRALINEWGLSINFPAAMIGWHDTSLKWTWGCVRAWVQCLHLFVLHMRSFAINRALHSCESGERNLGDWI